VGKGRFLKKIGLHSGWRLMKRRKCRKGCADTRACPPRGSGNRDEKGIESLSMRLLVGGSGLNDVALTTTWRTRRNPGRHPGTCRWRDPYPPVGAEWRSAMKSARSRRGSPSSAIRGQALMDSRVSSGPARLRYFDAMIGHCMAPVFIRAACGHFRSGSYIYGFDRQRRTWLQ